MAIGVFKKSRMDLNWLRKLTSGIQQCWFIQWKQKQLNGNAGALSCSSKKTGLKVNTEKATYTLMHYQQNAKWNHMIKIASNSFKYVVKFKYLRMIVQIKITLKNEIRDN